MGKKIPIAPNDNKNVPAAKKNLLLVFVYRLDLSFVDEGFPLIFRFFNRSSLIKMMRILLTYGIFITNLNELKYLKGSCNE